MSETTAKQHDPGRTSFDRAGVLILATLCIAMFTGGMNATGLQPFLVDIGADLEMTVPAVGQAVTVTLLMSAVSGMIAGPIADHFGHRRLMVAGGFALVISALGTSLALNYTMFIGSRVLGGASLALLNGLSLAIAGSYFAGEARRRALSVTVAAMSGTGILGVPLLSWIGDVFGWRWAFGVLGVGGILLIPLLHRLIPLTIPATSAFQLRQIIQAYRPLLHQRSVVALYVANFIRAVFWMGILTYFGAYVIEWYGLSLQQVGVLYLVGGTGFLLGSLTTGTRIGRFDHRRMFAIVTIVGGLFFGMSYVVATGAVSAITLLTVGGFFGGMGMVLLNTMIANESRAGSGTTMSLNTAIFNLGSATGGAVGGGLLLFGDYTTLGYVLPLLALTASVIVWFTRRAAPALDSARIEPVVQNRSSGG